MTNEPNERLSPERAVRLLRAKAAELEALVRMNGYTYLPGDAAADIALIAGLLADLYEESLQSSDG